MLAARGYCLATRLPDSGDDISISLGIVARGHSVEMKLCLYIDDPFHEMLSSLPA